MESKTRLTVLRRRSDFLHLQKRGKRVFPSSWMVVNYLENGMSDLRVGWTIPKFVGSAVLRNRFKRWCRDSLRRAGPGRWAKIGGLDVNIVLRRKEKEFYKGLGREEFDVVLDKALRRLSALAKS